MSPAKLKLSGFVDLWPWKTKTFLASPTCTPICRFLAFLGHTLHLVAQSTRGLPPQLFSYSRSSHSQQYWVLFLLFWRCFQPSKSLNPYHSYEVRFFVQFSKGFYFHLSSTNLILCISLFILSILFYSIWNQNRLKVLWCYYHDIIGFFFYKIWRRYLKKIFLIFNANPILTWFGTKRVSRHVLVMLDTCWFYQFPQEIKY